MNARARTPPESWVVVPQLVRRFNLRVSLPRTALPTLWLRAGFGGYKLARLGPRIALTCSIDESQARLWLWFARRSLGSGWSYVVADSAGDMRKEALSGALLTRIVNWYHGKKLDVLLSSLGSGVVYIGDDDRYLSSDLRPLADRLAYEPWVPVISLAPRRWWRFWVCGERHAPMGSYSLLVNLEMIRSLRLRFESPPHVTNPDKVTEPGAKHQPGYDTGDYANHELLRAGFRVDVPAGSDRYALGFDSTSTAAIAARLGRGARLIEALETASHYREGSVAGSVLHGVYSRVSFERLYEHVFGETPLYLLGATHDQIRQLVAHNSRLEEAERVAAIGYMDDVDSRLARLLEAVNENQVETSR